MQSKFKTKAALLEFGAAGVCGRSWRCNLYNGERNVNLLYFVCQLLVLFTSSGPRKIFTEFIRVLPDCEIFRTLSLLVGQFTSIYFNFCVVEIRLCSLGCDMLSGRRRFESVSGGSLFMARNHALSPPNLISTGPLELRKLYSVEA